MVWPKRPLGVFWWPSDLKAQKWAENVTTSHSRLSFKHSGTWTVASLIVQWKKGPTHSHFRSLLHFCNTSKGLQGNTPVPLCHPHPQPLCPIQPPPIQRLLSLTFTHYWYYPRAPPQHVGLESMHDLSEKNWTLSHLASCACPGKPGRGPTVALYIFRWHHWHGMHSFPSFPPSIALLQRSMTELGVTWDMPPAALVETLKVLEGSNEESVKGEVHLYQGYWKGKRISMAPISLPLKFQSKKSKWVQRRLKKLSKGQNQESSKGYNH